MIVTEKATKPELSEAAKAARSAYTKEYRRKHPEKVRQWNINYWEKVAKQMGSEKK